MSEICHCPYMDEVTDSEEDRKNGLCTPTCRNPNPCDYPFYCPIKKEKPE